MLEAVIQTTYAQDDKYYQQTKSAYETGEYTNAVKSGLDGLGKTEDPKIKAFTLQQIGRAHVWTPVTL